MKKNLKDIFSWLNVGFVASPKNFIFSFITRACVALFYYYLMITTTDIIDAFTLSSYYQIKIMIVKLLVIATLSVSVLVLQDINDTKLNISLKRAYTELIARKLVNVDVLNFEKKDYQNELNYAVQAMNGTQLFSPTLAIVNILFGTISNIAVIAKTTKGLLGFIIFFPLIIVFFIGLKFGTEKNKMYFESENELMQLLRQKNNNQNILVSNHFFKENLVYNFSEHIKKRWNNKYCEIDSAKMHAVKKAERVNLMMETIITVLFSMILFLVIKYNNQITAGSVVVLIGTILSLLNGTKNLSAFLSMFLRSIETILKIEKFVCDNSLKQLNIKSKSYKVDSECKSVSFKNVYFNYPTSNNNVLENVSIDIPLNKVTAIVGENGSGKTTLIKLLCGIYRPSKGSVTIGNDEAYERFNIYDIPTGISTVFQGFGKYYGLSLEDNIELGNVSFDSNSIISELGLIDSNGILGNDLDGTDFSGGQWQKIAIYRAIAPNNDIIIFDEPTAALDPITEKSIFEKLIELSKGKTLIIVTHRMGAAKKADEIIVLDNHNVVECGTHMQLIGAKGKYYEMYNSQSKWYEESEDNETGQDG